MKISRLGGMAAALGAGALVLAGCAAPEADSGLDEGTSVNVAWNQAFYSANGNTSFGNATANNNINYLTQAGFNFFDNTPELVEDTSFGSYELTSEDPQVAEYTLNEGLNWSDGEPIDGADLMLAWASQSAALNQADFDPSQFQDPDTGEFTEDYPTDVVYFDAGGTGLDNVTEVPELSDDGLTITLRYDDPYVDWQNVFATPGMVLPAHVVAADALGIDDPAEGKQAILDAIQENDTTALAAISNSWNTVFNFTETPENEGALVASGPYMITELVADQSITLVANPEYTGDREPSIEEVTIRFIPDPLAAVTALENGEVDVISPQATTDVVAGLEELDDVSIITGVEGTYEHIDLQFDQSKSGHFNNPLIREAFLKTIPRQQIVETLVQPIVEDAEVRNSFLFLPGEAGYDDAVANNGSDAYEEVDIEGAQALLAEAGVASPEVCILYASNNPRRVNEFALIQESANSAGFNVTDCGSTEWGGLLGTAGAYDASLFGWQTTAVAVADTEANYVQGGTNNLSFYNNPEVDALYAELGAEFDAERQLEIKTEIDSILWADSYGTTVFQFPAVTGVSNRVDGVDPSPIAPTIFWNLTDWTITE